MGYFSKSPFQKFLKLNGVFPYGVLNWINSVRAQIHQPTAQARPISVVIFAGQQTIYRFWKEEEEEEKKQRFEAEEVSSLILTPPSKHINQFLFLRIRKTACFTL